MKVVQTSKAYWPVIGGIETTITNLSEGLIRKGIEVEVLVCRQERSFRMRNESVHGVPTRYAPSWGFVSSLPISPTYGKLLAGMSGDILHIHEPFPLASLSVLMSGSVFRNFSRIVVSWHSDIIRQQWVLSMYRPLIHKFLRMVDSIVVSTPHLIESSEFLPNYRDRCEVIPLGVNLQWAAEQQSRRQRVAEVRQQFGTPLLLFVGRLVYYKGLEILLDAMSLVANARLLIVGAGPLDSSLRKQIADRRLGDRVTILPPVAEQELHAYYEACDVFVLPSTEKSETYGLVQIEAMASGKPVISTRLNTGVTFVNLDGVTGLSVPPRDSQALADAIETLINDPGLRQSLGSKGRERAFREFSAEAMVDKMSTLYERLLKQDRVSVK